MGYCVFLSLAPLARRGRRWCLPGSLGPSDFPSPSWGVCSWWTRRFFGLSPRSLQFVNLFGHWAPSHGSAPRRSPPLFPSGTPPLAPPFRHLPLARRNRPGHRLQSISPFSAIPDTDPGPLCLQRPPRTARCTKSSASRGSLAIMSLTYRLHRPSAVSIQHPLHSLWLACGNAA